MITTKQRAYLRNLANRLDPIFQVGKLGIEDTFVKQVEEAIEKRELIKIHVLENCELSPKEAQRILMERTNCEGIQVIGRKIVIYKEAEKLENRRIELPR